MSSKLIRVKEETYAQLESAANGFETPNCTISRILKDHKYNSLFKMVVAVISSKIAILNEEPEVDSTSATLIIKGLEENADTVATEVTNIFSNERIEIHWVIVNCDQLTFRVRRRI